jgi:hypothetical protein
VLALSCATLVAGSFLVLSDIFLDNILTYFCHLVENKITDAEKEIIVNKHNQLRSLIARGKVPGQPKGKNLKNLVSAIN